MRGAGIQKNGLRIAGRLIVIMASRQQECCQQYGYLDLKNRP